MTDFVPPPSQFDLPKTWVIAAPAEGQTLWRITLHERPSLFDFFSFTYMRDPHRAPPILSAGVSMFAERAQAEGMRDRFKKGQSVMPVQLNDPRRFTLARTGHTPGHHTVWGTPEDLLLAALDTQE